LLENVSCIVGPNPVHGQMDVYWRLHCTLPEFTSLEKVLMQ